jgi:hypothetical protein
MAHKIIKLLSYVAKMTELTVAKTIGFNIPKMSEFTITKWLNETRKWLTQAPNGWANTENGKDAWVRTRRVGQFMRECFNSCGHVGTLRLEQGWHIAYVYIYRAIVIIYIYMYGAIVFLPLSRSPIVILSSIFQLCDITPTISKWISSLPLSCYVMSTVLNMM